MARRKKKEQPKVDLLSRLEMIKERHRRLILEPRKEIADDLAVDFGDASIGTAANPPAHDDTQRKCSQDPQEITHWKIFH